MPHQFPSARRDGFVPPSWLRSRQGPIRRDPGRFLRKTREKRYNGAVELAASLVYIIPFSRDTAARGKRQRDWVIGRNGFIYAWIAKWPAFKTLAKTMAKLGQFRISPEKYSFLFSWGDGYKLCEIYKNMKWPAWLPPSVLNQRGRFIPTVQ